jgi:azurin
MRISLLVILLAAPALAHAEGCSIDLKTSDTIKYDQRSVSTSASCETITIHLTHTGKLPAATMGHNVVIAPADVYQSVAQDGMGAGLAGNYVKAGDARIIAATKVIGGGESTSTMFPGNKLKAGSAYKFFCTVPGHLALMTGQLIVK